MKKGYRWAWIMVLVLIFFGILAAHTYAQVFPGNYDPTNLFPLSYFYTNPLSFNGYGYVNSLTDPFYYIGYGYFPPIIGNLLGWYRVDPFLNPYENYLYNYFGFNTFPYTGSTYTTVFPFNTIPGTIIPYTRFNYPTYTYGSPSNYLNWVLFQ